MVDHPHYVELSDYRERFNLYDMNDETCKLIIVTDDELEILRKSLKAARKRQNWVDYETASGYMTPDDDDWDTIEATISDLEERLMSACDYVTLDDANNRVGINEDTPLAALHVVGEPSLWALNDDGTYGLKINQGNVSLTADDWISIGAPTITLDGNTLEFKVAGDVVLSVKYVSETVNQVQVNDLTFPATQVPATDANTLDDYEEGTCVVALVPQTSGTITLKDAYKTMAYTKIGRVVHVTGLIQVDSVSSPVGILRLTGLPFTSAAGAQSQSGLAVYCYGLAAPAVTHVMGHVMSNATYANITKFSVGEIAPLAGDVKAGTTFILTITYFAAA
jgi:hypothetical protein